MRCIFLFFQRNLLQIFIYFLHNNRFSSHEDTEGYHSYRSPNNN
jgi:hypothetical protein